MKVLLAGVLYSVAIGVIVLVLTRDRNLAILAMVLVAALKDLPEGGGRRWLR